jgi:adenine-specific DNA-methyltransferase
MIAAPVSATNLLERVDLIRLDAARRLDPKVRGDLGQFLTPAPVARILAEMFRASGPSVRILDPGAGVGSLSAALVARLLVRPQLPTHISVTAYEIDPVLGLYLTETLETCGVASEADGVEFSWKVEQEDFIAAGVDMLGGGLFADRPEYDCVILNPPYRKIGSASRSRLQLRAIGVETSNLYTGFVAVAARLLVPGGEMVAIVPRSFCNGPYFRPFRQWFLSTMSLRQLDVFESRTSAFRDDEVLQENLIFRAVRDEPPPDQVTIVSRLDAGDEVPAVRHVPFSEVVRPADPDVFIRLAPDELSSQVSERMGSFTSSLHELNIGVSTGRVVDFRAEPYLRADPGHGTVPLIYPGHLSGGRVVWPKPGSKKPNALVRADATEGLLVQPGTYVLVKRFTAKEERRRVVAAIYHADDAVHDPVGFENHLNYYHRAGGGLPPSTAGGLAAFLNSSLVDAYFRQFNGHTQVNATDLRSIGYPTLDQLERLGHRIGDTLLEQPELDRIVGEELFDDSEEKSLDPIRAKRRIDEALGILRDLGLPREQQNERSALTLLALLDLTPDKEWSEASDPLLGITPMMEFFAREYGKTYAPNTRETVRRQTVHQFRDAGLIVSNPDEPERATNSPKAVYQIEPGALGLLRTYGSEDWDKNLRTHLSSTETLRKRYAAERQMARIPITLSNGTELSLSPGGQNILVKQIVEEFCPRFTPGGIALYVGDTGDKFAFTDAAGLARLGIQIEEHGKMPDLMVYRPDTDWLVLIEAVTSHGPVNPKRRAELQELFKDSTAPLVFVTAFLDRAAMVKYLSDIAWETEVWVAEAPTHLIHFNGERFLGPHEA